MGTTASFAECCVDAYDDSKKEEDKKQALVDQQEYENGLETKQSDTFETSNVYKQPISNIVSLKIPQKEVAPWNNNSPYRNQLSYMEMSAGYREYKKPPNFYDDCIRKLRSTKKHYKSTQKQAQYDAIIQYTSKALLRTRTMLTASFEGQQQTSGTNLIHEISEDDEKFWFQPFLYNVIDSITNSFIKLIDSKQDLLLNYTDFYQILQSLPILGDILSKDYPFHYHSQIQDRLKYLFNADNITYIKTKQDIINLIKRANEMNSKICAVGYANSIPSNHKNEEKEEGNNLSSLLIAAMIPNHLRIQTQHIKLEYNDDLSKVSIPEYPLMFVEDIGNNKIRIGGGTPVWLYREWCHKRIEANKSIPSEPCSAMSLYHSFVGLITVGEHVKSLITLSSLCIYIYLHIIHSIF